MNKKNDDLNKYQDLVSRIRIEHPSYAEAFSELASAFDAIGRTAVPVCLLLTGESRTGKSSVVHDMLELHVPVRIEDQLIRNVVYAVAPAKATVKALLESLLKGLGDPFWSRGSESNMTQRLYTMLDAVQCRMIILDEFQHLCEGKRSVQIDKLADWLKVLLETRHYGLVAVGLPEAASVINTNRQMVNRFDARLSLSLFDWRCETSARQFRGVLRQFQAELAPFQLPRLSGEEMALRMYLASAGRIGLVAKLLDRAVRDAIRREDINIRLEDLAKAYERAIWSSTTFPVVGGPFGAQISMLSTETVLESCLHTAAMENACDLSGAVTVHQPKRGSDQKNQLATPRKIKQELEKAL